MAVRAGKPFSVRIFLQDGHADGVRVVSRSKWSGRGLVIPRAALAAELGRTELKAPGVYLLDGTGTATDRAPLVIGAADPVCDGLAQAAKNPHPWSTAIIFTCKEDGLSSAQCQSIAARLRLLAGDAAVSAAGYRQPAPLNPTEQADADRFLDHILGLYPLFGVRVFEPHLD